MKSIFKIITLILIISAAGFAQNNADGLLRKLQNKFDATKDFSADFKQSINEKVKLSGKFYYKQKDKFKLLLNNMVVVSNGTTNWNYNKKLNKVIISNYDKSDPSVFSLETIIHDYPAGCDISMVDGESKVIKLVPKKGENFGFNYVQIWINGKDLISKIVVNDFNNSDMAIEFSNYALNSGLSDSLFNFTPPEGSSVIDLR